MTHALLSTAGVIAQTGFQYESQGNPLLGLLPLCIGGTIGLAIMAVVAYLVSDAIDKIPPQYRRDVSPGQAWLLLIPLFNLVWNFILYPKVLDSFRGYFESTGQPQPGDYGRQIALWYSICAACSIIPCLGFIAAIAALVLLIILLIKITGYKQQVVATAARLAPPPPPPPAAV